MVAILVGTFLVFGNKPQALSETLEKQLPPQEVQSPQSLRIIMVGDIMFDRHIRAVGEAEGYDSLFASTSPLFKQADIVVANLEGPVTSNQSKTLLLGGRIAHGLAFTFSTSTPAALVRAGVSLVSLANNHTDNFGRDGFTETEATLDTAGLSHFGDPWNDAGTEKVISKNGITVAFVGYHAFGGGAGAFDRVLRDVKRLSDAGDFVVVMPHWGEEYVSTTSPELRTKAQALADAGAGAIVGSHSHVVGEQEWMGNVPVIYSLGNFIFDQYFSKKVMSGEIVDITLRKDAAAPHGAVISAITTHETSLSSHKGPSIVSEEALLLPH